MAFKAVFRLLAVALIGAALAACASDSGPKEVGGTLVGAGAGAAIGNASAGGRQSRVRRGRGCGDRRHDRQPHRRRPWTTRTSAAPMPRRCRRWRAGRPARRWPGAIRIPGRYGSIVPGPAYESNGMNCRQFTHTIYIDGKPQTARGTACRDPDGTWQPV